MATYAFGFADVLIIFGFKGLKVNVTAGEKPDKCNIFVTLLELISPKSAPTYLSLETS